jgi:hypothetical protein
MTTIKAHFDGKAIIPDEPANLPINEPLTVHVEAVSTGTAQKSDASFEEALRLMDQEALTTNSPVDDSRESIYSGTLDDPR